MKNFKKPFSILFILTGFLLFTTACSKDDNSSSGGSDLGYMNVSVTGDFTAEKSGMADFDLNTYSSTTMFDIVGHEASSQQTFSVELIQTFLDDEPSIPAPGTYQIGFDPLNSQIFLAGYTHIVDGNYNNATDYDTMDGGGTLTIESSNENTIKGRFEFTAHSRDDDFEINGTIQVVGDFKANRRIHL